MNKQVVRIGIQFIALGAVSLFIGIGGFSRESQINNSVGFDLASFWLIFVYVGIALLIVGLLILLGGYRSVEKSSTDLETPTHPVSKKLCPECGKDITFQAVCPNCGYVVTRK